MLQYKKLADYKHKLQELLDDFQEIFNGLQKLKPCFAFLVNPFEVDMITNGCPVSEPLVSEASVVEMGLLELQEDLCLKMVHKSPITVEFWKQVPALKYPELKKTNVQLISIFIITFCCESFYSVMKFVKSKHCAVLTNQH